MTPYGKLAALDLDWNKVGCDQLSLLNQTDRKLIRQLWGKPAQHATAHDLYRELFDRQARKIAAAEKRRQRERQERYMAEIDAIRNEEQGSVAPSTAREEPVKPLGFLTRLFGRR